MTTREEIEKGLAAAGDGLTDGLNGHYSAPVGEELAAEIVETVEESIRITREECGDLPWVWLKNGRGHIVAQFGCGPNAAALCDLFGNAPRWLRYLLEQLDTALLAYDGKQATACFIERERDALQRQLRERDELLRQCDEAISCGVNNDLCPEAGERLLDLIRAALGAEGGEQ